MFADGSPWRRLTASTALVFLASLTWAQETADPAAEEPVGPPTAEGEAPEQEEVAESTSTPRPGRERRVTWALRNRLGNEAELEFPTGDRSQPRVAIGRVPTGLAWHIRLGLGPFPLEGKTGYAVRFRARADGPREFSVGASQATPPYRGLGTVIEVKVTPLWKSYQTRVFIEEDEDAASLQFNFGGNRYSVELADVRLVRLADEQTVFESPRGQVRRPKEESESE